MPRPPRKPQTRRTQAEKQCVLDAFDEGRNWREVAADNGIPDSSAYRLVGTRRVTTKPRGGARAKRTKCTPEILVSLEKYLNENCDYTLEVMKAYVKFDHDVVLSTSTISRKLIDMLYTVKQTRVEPDTCNNDINKAERKVFAVKIRKHAAAGDFIVYLDETNYNLYCKRARGRAKIGERVTVKTAASKGPNLQIQCAVQRDCGLIHFRTERGSIKMDVNANFIDAVYKQVKKLKKYKEEYRGKKIVMVLDNAPAHSQTETRVKKRADMVTLRLAPYSPMCNPIEGCFSVLKAKVKDLLAMYREELASPPQLLEDGVAVTMLEWRTRMLEDFASQAVAAITPKLVASMELHARDAVNAALRMEDMQYGH